MAGALLALSLPGHAEPVAHEAAASAVDLAHPPLPADEHPDAATAAERAAIDALLHGQASRDRQAVLLQSFLGRPPTWIQTAAHVNLAEFPSVGDPTADAERHLETVTWLAEQRLLEPRAAAREAGAELVFSHDDPDWLDMLLPSRWLPLLREHRDEFIAAGAALLISGWGLNLLMQRVLARAARRRRRRSARHARQGSGRPDERGAGGLAREGLAGGSGAADDHDREADRRLRRRRRHRRRSSARLTDAGTVPSPQLKVGR